MSSGSSFEPSSARAAFRVTQEGGTPVAHGNVTQIVMALGAGWSFVNGKGSGLTVVGPAGQRYTQLPEYAANLIRIERPGDGVPSAWLDDEGRLHFLYSNGMRPVLQDR